MNRRFVNLVLRDYETRMHSLFRLDVVKHLFYPSTAQAEAANNNGGGGDKPPKPPTMKWPKPPRIKWLRPLPEASIRFFRLDGDEERNSWPSYDDAFMLLRPGSSSSEGTILHTTEGGRAVIYDADKHAISATVPFFDMGMGRGPIAFSVPGAGGKKESFYVMRSTITSPVRDRYPSPCNNGGEDCCSGDFVVLDLNQQPYKWQHLPRPAFIVDKDPYERGLKFSIRSSAVVDGGRTIVVSSDETTRNSGGSIEFTYCFDTATRQ